VSIITKLLQMFFAHFLRAHLLFEAVCAVSVEPPIAKCFGANVQVSALFK